MQKICTSCQESKDIEEFAKNKARADGHHNMCRPCKKVYNSVYYVKTKDRFSSSRAATRDDIRETNRAILKELKDVPCMDCGGKFPHFVMDFDHRYAAKVNDVSRLVNYSTQVMLDEVAKCDIVCSNCHRVRTHMGV